LRKPTGGSSRCDLGLNLLIAQLSGCGRHGPPLPKTRHRHRSPKLSIFFDYIPKHRHQEISRPILPNQ
jgi:hypothetical protein